MNKNNLEDLRAEMIALKVPEKLIAEAEKQMETGIERIALKSQLPADKGTMDLTMHFKRSEQSEYYYLNKFDLALSSFKPLEGDKKYLVIDHAKVGGSQKAFDSPLDAMANFKKRTGDVELAIGTKTGDHLTIASMKVGKVDYVNKEFSKSYYSPPLTHSFFVNRGVGFNIKQGANLLQGRSAYRDDLVSRAGEAYKAYSVIEFSEPKDKYDNYKMKQYSDPGYGFDMQKELSAYQIKELEDPKKLDSLLTALKDGDRSIVTVQAPNGEEQKMRIEAVPRFSNINFFELSGKPEKREAFQKEVKVEEAISKGIGKAKHKDMAEGLGI